VAETFDRRDALAERPPYSRESPQLRPARQLPPAEYPTSAPDKIILERGRSHIDLGGGLGIPCRENHEPPRGSLPTSEDIRIGRF